jgi:hypothetical protein
VIREVARFSVPGIEVMGVALDGPTLWVSCRESHQLFAVDTATHAVREAIETPGAPFGVAVKGGELRVVMGFGNDDDDRYIYRFVPGTGFDAQRIACPDLSGVHTAFDGDQLYLSQAHNMRILALDGNGDITRAIQLDRRPVGMAIDGGTFYLVTTDKGFKNLELTKLDASGETSSLVTLASIPFVARGLAVDGDRYWTGSRRENEVVAFVC